MDAYFGQGKREKQKVSPNTVLVQTGEAGNPRVESECRASSDKGSGKI